jgi:hypothetical protein
MMLSLIGSLVWIAFWLYFGAQVVLFDNENGPILSIIFFLPAFIATPIVGKI